MCWQLLTKPFAVPDLVLTLRRLVPQYMVLAGSTKGWRHEKTGMGDRKGTGSPGGCG